MFIPLTLGCGWGFLGFLNHPSSPFELIDRMVEAVLDYWSPRNKSVVTETGFSYLDTTSEIKNQTTISATNDIKLFEQFYKLNNSLRYCNGSHYTWQDAEWKNKYKAWLKSDDYKKKSFRLYYGNGVVD